ncbi:MAG: PDZ domain-containing protein [Planctomycetaceae bacterium]|nr:PDZ domain-containing protein [Planctomycetaceae bacterium]
MKRLLFLFVLIFTVRPPIYAADPIIHVIIAVDGLAGFGANLNADYRNMKRLFQENIPSKQLDLVLMQQNEIMPDKIFETIEKIRADQKDTLVFYYSGHAAHDIMNGGQYFQLKDKNGRSVALQRRTLLAVLEEKKTNLLILLTDCCNLEQKISGESKELPPAVALPEKMSPVFETLFLKPKGIADITSSKRGEASFTDSTSQKRGSCFTWTFVALLEKHRSNASITWTEFVEEWKGEVHKAFLQCYPDGYQFEPPLNGVSLQKSQTLNVNGLLPGTEQTSGTYQGPRFGIRAVNHSSGVQVMQIIPNSPGQRAGFEIGDVIVEINGTPIRNEQDYANAVDNSPKKITVKVVNVNDKQTIDVTFELGY